ncbi:hypothetical protein [Kribbella deserti]|uniref:Secreted protein n=1 Tax=Kribbella deserti TaxID=1926257 RepID=A0ABV6QPF1_9ACTN
MSTLLGTTRRVLTAVAATAMLTLTGAGIAAAAPAVDEGPAKSVATSAGTLIAAAPPACNVRIAVWYGETCFQANGDEQWIRDLDPNGWQAWVHVQTNYGKNRYCGALPAADGWGKCSYDHDETKCVRFRMYEEKAGEERNFTSWTAWHKVSTGALC